MGWRITPSLANNQTLGQECSTSQVERQPYGDENGDTMGGAAQV